MANNSSSLNCFEIYDVPKYRVILGIRSGLSVLSGCSILCMIGIIVFFKKYKFFTQRLILYLAISSFSYSVCSFLNVTDLIAYKSKPALYYCIILGFGEQLIIWWELMSVAVIMFNVFIRAVWEKCTDRLEWIYVLIIFIFPFSFNWIPFINLAYGPANVFCWIRSVDLEDCSDFNFGVWLRFSLYYIPLYTLMITLIILLAIAIFLVRYKRKRWFGQYDYESKKKKEVMEKEIRSLLPFPLICFIINLFPLSRRLYELHNASNTFYYILTLVEVIVFRLEGVLITLVFVLDPETRQKLTCKEIHGTLHHRFFKKSSSALPYPVRVDDHSDSRIFNSVKS